MLLEAERNRTRYTPDLRDITYWQRKLESDEGGRNWFRVAENVRRHKQTTSGT